MSWRVISRASRLARLQTEEALRCLPSAPSTVTALESLGDKNKQTSLLEPGVPTDFFTRELDEALRRGEADFAVHSAKDLPFPLPLDLTVVALLPAADQTDALVCRAGIGTSLEDLAPGAKIGTSSPLRRQELLARRPDLTVEGIRGTIEERLQQVDDGRFDAVVVATCALQRLGWAERITQILPFATHPLQGHLAVVALTSRHDVAALWSPHDLRRQWGSVALVGAGPGDPGLLTVRAASLLASADVIYTDSLANPALLEGLRAEVRAVGKRGDAGGELQERINQALAETARAGKTVVRLKGGDPMVFGRGTEEREYLEQRLIDVEVVPGITAAAAASSYTSIPLTERSVSNSVAFCLGAPADRIAVPDAETLVYYMASATLAVIVAKLLAAGRAAETPIALVRNASLTDQSVWTSTLGSLQAELEREPEHRYGSPLLAFVGPVVRPDRQTSWFDRRPRAWYAGTAPVLESARLRVVYAPLIRIAALTDPSNLDNELAAPNRFDAVVFTSRHTVEAVWSRLDALGADSRRWAGVQVAAVGRSTARALADHGIRADLVPEVESAAGVLAALDGAATSIKGKRVWLPASDLSSGELAEGLALRGATVTRTVAYTTQTVDQWPAGIDLDALDQVLITSPSVARALFALRPTLPAHLLLVPRGLPTATELSHLYPGHPQGTWPERRASWT